MMMLQGSVIWNALGIPEHILKAMSTLWFTCVIQLRRLSFTITPRSQRFGLTLGSQPNKEHKVVSEFLPFQSGSNQICLHLKAYRYSSANRTIAN